MYQEAGRLCAAFVSIYWPNYFARVFLDQNPGIFWKKMAITPTRTHTPVHLS